MATIQGVKGAQYVSGTKDWKDWRYQYATSSHEHDTGMDPALIIRPTSREDIALVLKYAKEHKIAVAIRTGGHQYSGASSTKAPNIQLDLSQTFRGPDDRAIKKTDDGKALAFTSISWRLGDFNQWLGENQVFIPHGQCVHVGLGGHVQTGGYGQLGRSFGLFGDHVRQINIVDHDGNFKEVTKEGEPDLFFALLGGSPGNFAVITHLWLEVHRDENYPGARGMKPMFWYSPETLKKLLDILVEMSDDDDFPRNYDYCVSALSSNFVLPALFPGTDNRFKDEHPELFGKDGVFVWPRTIVVYAQWVPFSKADVYDDKVKAWFKRINDAGKPVLDRAEVLQLPMSKMTPLWIFRNTREFNLPYTKRTYLTRSRDLARSGWSDWVSKRVDKVIRPIDNAQWISAQFQCFGGKNSKFTTNAGNGTAYSWRDSSLCATIDNFHEDRKKKDAEAWQKTNDEEGIGANGKFSKDDRRVLWGSYGSLDLDSVWQTYYEDKEKYQKLQQIRKKADPDGVFTPNTFCVKRAS